MTTRDLTREEIGNDVSTFLHDGTMDLDLTFEPITGAQVVAQGVARRWVTERGSMFWAPEVGVALFQLQNQDNSAVSLARWKIILMNEASKEDGVLSLDVEFDFNRAEKKVTAKADIRTKAGNSELLVEIGEASRVLGVTVTA